MVESYSFLYDPIPDVISIIIPTHNRDHYITETLNSIEKQQYNQIEIKISFKIILHFFTK